MSNHHIVVIWHYKLFAFLSVIIYVIGSEWNMDLLFGNLYHFYAVCLHVGLGLG